MPESTQQQGRVDAPSPHLPWLVLLFVGSGCAALVYEIVWFQLLSLIVGSSAISLGVLLATFMGGLCLGSIGLSRVVSTQPHPAARLRPARGRDRGLWPARVVAPAIRGWSLRVIRRTRDGGARGAGGLLRALLAPAHRHDGRDPTRDRAVGGGDAARRRLARLLLRRQHVRGRARLLARGDSICSESMTSGSPLMRP